MKITFPHSRPVAMLAICCSLAACGGTQSFDLGGTVTGLNNAGLVLANGGTTVSVPSGSTLYQFPDKLSYGTSFNVTVQTQPAHMTCLLGKSSGSAGTTSTVAVNVVCALNTYSLGGTVTGLKGTGLVLNNGSDILSVTAATGDVIIAFPTLVGDGAAYGVTVLTQPTGQTCSVANGTGTMGAAAVTNVRVTCI